jgi:hypothetical protein
VYFLLFSFFEVYFPAIFTDDIPIPRLDSHIKVAHIPRDDTLGLKYFG